MTRSAVLAAVVLWAGSTLVLGEIRRTRTRSLAARVLPFRPGAPAAPAPKRRRDEVRALVLPLAHAVGTSTARAFGVHEDLATRLERVHDTTDPAAFRLRQLGLAGAALAVGALMATLLPVPPMIAALLVLGSPLLALLVTEHHVTARSERWQQQVFLELPVVSEQLAMLLSAGFSLGSALSRLAGRSHGACAADLGRVCRRLRQGVDEVRALEEWAEVSGVDAVGRLVRVLALDRTGTDLGRLIAEEARTTRREAQRRLAETLDRRAQQVWVPVTVATLVPGVLFLAVPFIEAMRLFTTV